jgi:hypothetical protein
MPWNSNTIDSEILAVHVALMPSGPAGEVLLFGGDEHWSAQQEPDGDFRKTRVYDVQTHSLVSAAIPSPDTDVFCAGHAYVSDGRLLIVGGTKAWSTGHGHALAFWGHRRCWLYNPRERTWAEVAQLLPDPNGDGSTGGGRWYPGAVTMGNGQVLALFGHVAQDDSRHRNASPERFSVGANAWFPLPKLANDAANYAPHGGLDVRFLFFTRTFQLPDGTLFFATPMPVEFAANTSGDSDPTDGPHFSSRYDPAAGAYVGHKIPEPAGYEGWSFPCVLLPLLPGDDYRPRVLHCGRSQAQRVDLGAAAPAWQPVTTALGVNRFNSCAVLLPTGEVALVGGVENQGSDADQKLPAEIYDPGINWATGQYDAGLGSWSSDGDLPTTSRNYHSAAMLLPNGSVLTTAGNRNADAGDPNVVGHKNIELFEPPYPAGARPTVSSAPAVVAYGESFRIDVSNAADIRRVALLRNGSCTHSYDHDQRYVGLQFSHSAGDTFLTATAPPTGNVAPPGYYMLWVVDSAGRPCQLARFIRVAHLGCSVVTDRSTFSEEEIESLGTPATIPNAVLVDFDGFIHTELSGTPTVSVRWADTNDPVPSSDFQLVAGPRLLEVDPGRPDVPQRITYPYGVRFNNTNVFAGFTDRRQLRITFTLGHHTCAETLDLTKAPNPYMIDVDAATNNPHWLSTDVRVFKTLAGESRFGVSQGAGGGAARDFIRGVLDEFNAAPNNSSHPFLTIATDQSDSALDLASHFGALQVFNYAVAKVRYRATMTTAQRVKVFFRLFNTVGTALEYNTSTTYRRTAAGPDTVPLLGTSGGEIVSIPFFVGPRVETVSGEAGAASMTAQALDPAYEIKDISPVPGQEVTMYFGCWLDINRTKKRFPVSPGATDGPWPSASARSIQELMRGRHQCLVTEIFFEPDPTANGETPGTSDNLSQRNLALLHSDNPGGPDSHTVAHTFEVKPSSIPAVPPGADLAAFAALPTSAPSLTAAGIKRFAPDELLLRWHNLPRDSEVTLYFSDIDTAEIARLAGLRRSPAAFAVVDKRTIRFRVAGATWVPLPGGRSLHIPALLTIKLPDGVTNGQHFRVSVHQIDGRDRSVIGAFELGIPVSKAALILEEEERALSVLRHIATTIPPANRWYDIFKLYLDHLSAKVDALGGDPSTVHPNPDGSGNPYVPPGARPGRKPCREGWLVSLVLALALVLAAFATSPLVLAVVLVAGLVLLALPLSLWRRKCCGRNRCALLDHLALAAAVAAFVIVLAAAAGGGGPFLLAALLAAALLAAASVVASFALGCRGGCCDERETDDCHDERKPTPPPRRRATPARQPDDRPAGQGAPAQRPPRQPQGGVVGGQEPDAHGGHAGGHDHGAHPHG